MAANLPPCGGDVRQDRGGQRRALSFCILIGLATAPSPALAACPIELSTYGDVEDAASINFRPTGDNATVTNTFRLIIGEVVLDGIVMWSDGVGRPNGILSYKCPIGDVTGPELEACTAWQGVIYTSDGSGNIGLLPAEGEDAPQKLILSDLTHALRFSAVREVAGIEKLPWDVFALNGCQE
ncbi:hypothetical protein RB623_23770 [Mesorhizobium sp. LHD-90]|uniref:hypothetical protein n=1 Tax=Mesorhizobium sp. LHD-90 TaxID=3071414 RepID=UPI0027DFFAD5|nr:hypothetical protein [Mesorhizobium sp. LHD-90]MDQ6437082.1 hypothetical protein [Mesorhizobium sp. LHD-90]